MQNASRYLRSDRPLTAKDWGVDVAVAAAALLFGVAQLMLEASNVIIPDLAMRQYLGMVSVVPSTAVYVALCVTTLPVAARRAFPWPVFALTCAALVVSQAMFDGLTMPIAGPVVALFTVASERTRNENIAATAVLALIVLVVVSPESTALLTFYTAFIHLACVVGAALAGYAYSAHRAYVAEMELRMAEAQRTREEEAARRVEEERVRIAREVHDITAHSLSAVSVQAAAAERLIDRDPQAAKDAIAAVRATSKQALDDIRAMIGVLRHGEGAAEQAPTAGVERMGDVVAYLQDAGIAVDLQDQTYDRDAVPTHIDVALYHVAREASTNIVRHSGARHVRLWLNTGRGWAQLCVDDDGAGCGTPVAEGGSQDALPQAADGSGNGMAGMAERVRVLGGTFTAGDMPGGGFRVAASIPLHGTGGE